MNGQVTIPNSMTLRDDQPPIAFESALNAMIIVAHPIEETLLAGGLMQMVPHWRWRVISFCPGPNRERRRTFFEAMKRFEAMGSIADLNEGYTQQPLHDETVESEIELELPNSDFDLVITHNPFGEYSRHIRHEEVSRGVTSLWKRRLLRAKELWYFAYSDEERAHLPSAIETAHLSVSLSETVWQRKQEIMSDVYGFSKESWAYRTTPRHEAFWRFHSPEEAFSWQLRKCFDYMDMSVFPYGEKATPPYRA